MHTTRTLFLLVAGSLLGFLPPREPVPSHTEAAPPAVTPMPKITTALWFAKEAEAAVHYYVSVFADGKILDETRWPEGSVGPKGSLISATFRVAGMELIAINGNPESHFNDSMSLLVQCDTQQEIDHYWQKLSADGKGQCGWTKDKFGVTWQVAPRQLLAMMSDRDPVKVKRVIDAMMPMAKLDLAALQKAFAGK